VRVVLYQREAINWMEVDRDFVRDMTDERGEGTGETEKSFFQMC
jgi:hypothetical protein